jgi:ADP-ribose pyrophosphatase YjhB (NUDIX family)
MSDESGHGAATPEFRPRRPTRRPSLRVAVTIENLATHPEPVSPQGPAGQFRYCPRCGQAGPRIRESRSLRCSHCDFLYFFNSAAAAAAFVFHQGRLVLCVRAKDPAKGMLDLPGGFIEFDESVEAGLKREIYEELRLEASEFRYLTSASNDYCYAGVPYKTTDLFFVCEVKDLEGIRPADDVADYLLLAPEELDPARLAFNSGRAAFAALREWPDRKAYR